MKDYRPGYHYLPKKNWINDPCGLIQHKGTYHLYYQYDPNGDQWGDMHWGHATSQDMIDWHEEPVALGPEQGGDEDHIFTGCGGHLPDGSAIFYYTSISRRRAPEQRMAFPADDSLMKLVQTRENALTVDMHAPGMEVSEWRDPNVIPYKGGYLLTAGCRLGDHGAALLYTSPDGVHFTYHSVLAEANGGEDYSWECPNFFPVGNKYVLVYSPYRQPLYIVGTLTDGLRFIPEGNGVLDESGQEGHYAPQAFKDEGGRTLLMNWLTERSRGKWDGIHGWSGCQSLPKEVYLENGIVKMRVIPEVEKLVTGSGEFELPIARREAGEQYRLVIDAELAADGVLELEVLATGDGSERTKVLVNGSGRMVVDRGESSVYPTHHSLLERRISVPDGRLHLEIYVDHSVLEVCGNGEWISTRVYPAGDDCTGLTASLSGGSGRCVLSQMRSCGK